MTPKVKKQRLDGKIHVRVEQAIISRLRAANIDVAQEVREHLARVARSLN